jgi:hypothetical protein
VRYCSMLGQCQESHQRAPSALYICRFARTTCYYYKNVHQTNLKATTGCWATNVALLCTKCWWRAKRIFCVTGRAVVFLLTQAQHGSLEQLPSFGPHHKSASQPRGAVWTVQTPSLSRTIGFLVRSRRRFFVVSMGCGAKSRPSSRQ